MKINSSSVAMDSERNYQSVSLVRTSSILTSASKQNDGSGAASVKISDSSRRLLKLLEEEKKSSAGVNGAVPENSFSLPSPDDSLELTVLKRILELLKRIREGQSSLPNDFSLLTGKSQIPDLLSGSREQQNPSPDTASLKNGITGGNFRAQLMLRRTVTSGYFSEKEATNFNATGHVLTEDGREINFGISIGMSRSFEAEFSEVTQESIVNVFTDPLVINLDKDIASVSDQKFFFDINSDGAEDYISTLDSGSGYLVLDRNEDGIVNNGSELFGAKTGDGFLELAEFDSDENSWIDENDDIFSKLQIWTKDKDGNDILISLKEADVGALYLGNVSTDFMLNNIATNDTNAAIRKTGIYLKESGGAGTMQHIDLAL